MKLPSRIRVGLAGAVALLASTPAVAYQPYPAYYGAPAYHPYARMQPVAAWARPTYAHPAFRPYPAQIRPPVQASPTLQATPTKANKPVASDTVARAARPTDTVPAEQNRTSRAATPGSTGPLAEEAATSEDVSAPTLKDDTTDARRAFLRKLEPLVREENARLLALRAATAELVAAIDAGEVPDAESTRKLKRLATRYRVQGDPVKEASARRDLLARIDSIPVALALAQAVNESAWGTSRFAREGNNLFGIWTYDESKGIVPRKRAKGQKHLVRKFESLADSVRYYMFNLNSHPAYADLRSLRESQREAGEPLDGLALAAGLTPYSAKGEEYVRLIRDIIRRYRLVELEQRTVRTS